MRETVTLEQATRELASDHERLHGLIGRLGEAQDLAEITSGLRLLHERLTAHFNEEEKPDGLYDTLGFCAPEFRRPLARLVDDHFRLSATLRALRERAAAVGGVETDTLRVDVARLVKAIAEHEERELALVDAASSRQPRPAAPQRPVAAPGWEASAQEQERHQQEHR